MNERVLADGRVLFVIFCREKLDVWRVCVCKQAKECETVRVGSCFRRIS